MKNLKTVWAESDAVCFDVDSTLCTTEMIDELAAFCNVGEEVAEWTRKAMGEGISFRQALDARLSIIKPTASVLEHFKAKDSAVLTPGVLELITKLVALKKDIFLVSGGFQSLIKPIAKKIGISDENIFANRILFDEAGNYAGFDTEQPTSESGGKKVVMATLKEKFGYKSLVMIGDGMSDFEAYPTADLFIGFGGNIVRENVRAKAPWYVMNFNELIDCLP